FMDPDLSQPGTPPDTAATLGPVNVMGFEFNTIEIGSEGEAIDVDELRLGTTFDAVAPRASTPGPDAGTPAAGLAGDGGVAPDAGAMDAGTPSDAGAPPRAPSLPSGGCGCDTGGAPAAGPLLLCTLALLALRPRRRRRRSP